VTNSKLEKIRDETASKYGLDKFPVQNIKTTSEFTQDVNFARRMTHTQAFQDGHDASTAIHQQQIQKLIEALEFYESFEMYRSFSKSKSSHVSEDQGKRARQALNDFKAWSEK